MALSFNGRRFIQKAQCSYYHLGGQLPVRLQVKSWGERTTIRISSDSPKLNHGFG